MPQASTVRLTHALPLAFGLAFAWPEAADAGMYVPSPLPSFETAATPVGPEAPRARPIVGTAPAFGVDAEGRNISMSVPATVMLYGLARAEDVPARTVIEAAGIGTARLGLTLERPSVDLATAGTYVGVVTMSLDYN